jgi:hypothetical protein
MCVRYVVLFQSRKQPFFASFQSAASTIPPIPASTFLSILASTRLFSLHFQSEALASVVQACALCYFNPSLMRVLPEIMSFQSMSLPPIAAPGIFNP